MTREAFIPYRVHIRPINGARTIPMGMEVLSTEPIMCEDGSAIIICAAPERLPCDLVLQQVRMWLDSIKPADCSGALFEIRADYYRPAHNEKRVPTRSWLVTSSNRSIPLRIGLSEDARIVERMPGLYPVIPLPPMW